jgi:hypothetical protein
MTWIVIIRGEGGGLISLEISADVIWGKNYEKENHKKVRRFGRKSNDMEV